jgi:predicted nucleotidyltransferase
MFQIPQQYRADIETAKSYLAGQGCTGVYLFGSLVTGNARPDSDIDLGVKGLPPEKYFRVFSALDRQTEHKIDMVDFDSDSDFYETLDSLGEVVEIG